MRLMMRCKSKNNNITSTKVNFSNPVSSEEIQWTLQQKEANHRWQVRKFYVIILDSNPLATKNLNSVTDIFRIKKAA